MKKLLILTNDASGLYNFRFELIQRLLALNYDLYFAVPQINTDDNVKKIIDSGANFIHTSMSRRGMNPLEDLKLIKQYKNIMKTLNPDIILTYTIKPNIYGSYVASKFKIPVIMNITGIGSSLSTGKLKFIIKKMYKFGCKKAGIVFFQNSGNREFFISNQLINKDKTKIIPGSGVNTNKFIPLKKTKDDELIKFLFIGRLMRDKGIDEYLEVAEKITRKYSKVEFQILGGFEDEKYREIIEKNQNAKIKYLGISSDVRQEIKNVDCIINPSYHEGMSNVLLEGAAMGKPLLASNIPGCKEIIDEGINGFLFEPKSIVSLERKIITFINLPTNRKLELGKNSRIKVENEFDRRLVIEDYIQEINKIEERYYGFI